MKLSCESLEKRDKEIEYKFDQKVEKLDYRVDNIREDQTVMQKKFDSQTQIFRSKLDNHDNALQKQFTMIEEQRTKSLHLNEKVREVTLTLESTRTKLMNDIDSAQKDFTA